MILLSELIKKVFKGGHKGASLGIDIGSSSIKVVLVEKIKEKAVLRNYGEIALGPRVGIAVGQATNLTAEKTAEALNGLLKEAGIIAGHTFIAIPFSASLLSVVELPSVGKKDFESMLMNEARQYIPVPISEVSIDWWALPKRKSEEKKEVSILHGSQNDLKPLGKTEVIIAAIHNEVIKKYELIKRDVHIQSDSSHFEIEIFSTLRAVVGHDLSPIVVIDIGSGSTKLILVDEGVVRGSHVVSMGGQDITFALSRSRSISFEQAEEIKCSVGLLGDEVGRDILAVGEIIIANIMGEAVRFVENYERKYETKVTKIILVGGGARLMGIEKIVAKNFPNISIVIGDPFSRIDAPAFLSATLKDISPSFAVALGISLKGLEE